MNAKNSSSKSKKLSIPITDAISRIQFAPNSNNLLISSWDSVSLVIYFIFLLILLNWIDFVMLVFQNLRLYDFEASVVRLEANSEAALLDCCFSEDDDSVAFSVASDGFIRRFSSFSHSLVIIFINYIFLLLKGVNLFYLISINNTNKCSNITINI